MPEVRAPTRCARDDSGEPRLGPAKSEPHHRKLPRRACADQCLGLGDRRPVESEERYITDWMDKGFPPETVALAYDKTVFYKKELNWRYLNGILRRWHENGWHTEEEVRQSDSRKPSRREEKKDDSRMEKYMKW